jgi:hypothetical protein
VIEQNKKGRRGASSFYLEVVLNLRLCPNCSPMVVKRMLKTGAPTEGRPSKLDTSEIFAEVAITRTFGVKYGLTKLANPKNGRQ